MNCHEIEAETHMVGRGFCKLCVGWAQESFVGVHLGKDVVTQETSNQKGQWEGDQLGEQSMERSWGSSPTEPLQNPAPAMRHLWESNGSSGAEVFWSENGDDTFLAGC